MPKIPTQGIRNDLRQGYAIVRDEEVGRHFVTFWKDVEEDAGTEAVSGEKTECFGIPAWLRKQAD